MKKGFILLAVMFLLVPLVFSFALPLGEQGVITSVRIVSLGGGGCASSTLKYEVILDTGLVFCISELWVKEGRHPYPRIGNEIRFVSFDTGCWNYGVVDSFEVIRGGSK